MQYLMEKQSSKTIPIFVAIVVFATNISQMPIFVKYSLTQFISFPVWVLLLFLLIFKKEIIFNKIPVYTVFVAWLLFIFVLALEILTDRSYITIALLYPFYLSIFIFFIGMFLSRLLTYDDLIIIINSYIVSALIVAMNVFMQYLIRSNIYNKIYAYGPKNSLSEILATALVFLVIVRKGKMSSLMKIIKYSSALFLLVVIFLLKCRASIVGLFIVSAVILWFGEKQYRLKKTIISILVLFAILMLNDKFYDIVVHYILGAGSNWENLNAVSSGRYFEWKMFPHLLKGAELFGRGKYKIESFPFSVIVQFGIPIGVAIISIALWPLWWGYKKLDKSNPINLAFICITVLYLIDAIFEQLAPFGPGTRNYMLWLMFGILYGNIRSGIFNHNKRY